MVARRPVESFSFLRQFQRRQGDLPLPHPGPAALSARPDIRPEPPIQFPRILAQARRPRGPIGIHHGSRCRGLVGRPAGGAQLGRYVVGDVDGGAGRLRRSGGRHGVALGGAGRFNCWHRFRSGCSRLRRRWRGLGPDRLRDCLWSPSGRLCRPHRLDHFREVLRCLAIGPRHLRRQVAHAEVGFHQLLAHRRNFRRLPRQERHLVAVGQEGFVGRQQLIKPGLILLRQPGRCVFQLGPQVGNLRRARGLRLGAAPHLRLCISDLAAQFLPSCRQRVVFREGLGGVFPSGCMHVGRTWRGLRDFRRHVRGARP